MRAYEQGQVPGFQGFMQDLSSRFFGRACKQGNLEAHCFGIDTKALKMLVGKDLCRCHQAALRSRADGEQHANKGNHGFSTSHIPLNQSVHLLTRLHVFKNLPNHTLLSVCELEGKMLRVKTG